MNAVAELDWTTANQQLLVAEFARLRARFGDGDEQAAAAASAAARAAMPAPAAIDRLVETFGLSPFERDVLLLAAGVEMDTRLARLCAEAAGQPSRPWASFSLALGALAAPHWSALTPISPLRRWRLLDVDEAQGLTCSRLQVDERLVHFLGGINYLDHRLAVMLRQVPLPSLMSEEHRQVVTSAAGHLRSCRDQLPVVVLRGDDRDGQRDLAATVAARVGLTLYRLDVSEIPGDAGEQASLASLWQREAALLGAALLVEVGGQAQDERCVRFLDQLESVVFVAGAAVGQTERPTAGYAVERPEAPAQRALWRAALGARADTLRPVLETLAAQHRMSARRISRISAQLAGTADTCLAGELSRLCREDIGISGSLVQRIEPRAGWDDLILPDTQRRTLEQLVRSVRHRLRVHHDWGFAARGGRGLGIATLFWGDSGTGKTLAAEVLAGELTLPLYRVDLSAVVSKYIGETEKHLRQVFDSAEEAGAILLFDEADALFGKRSDVKDSHDRYANIEISYLLQRMEAYRGLAILTTNQKAALDKAFQRRLRFVVHFPFPDAAQREAIWRAALPAQAPLEDIDFAKLARLSVAGGTIRNISLNAAFFAAEAGGALTMAQLLRAARMEANKRETALSETETRGWV